MRIQLATFAFLFAAACHADALSDLHARLQAIKPTTPLSARIELRSTGVTEDDGNQSTTERTALIEATHDATGIRMNWASTMLDKARLQKAAVLRDPDTPKPGALVGLDANAALDLLDAAPDLLLALEGATLIESREDKFENKPSTLLTLKPRMSMAKKDIKRMKKFEYVAQLWLDADGWPVAMESQQHVKFSMMLMSFNTDTREKRLYGHTADRLFVTASSRDGSFEGFGQKTAEHATTAVTTIGQGVCQTGCR